MLTYILNDDGLSYCALEGADTAVMQIVVPDEYNGLPVTVLSANFSDFNNLKEIVTGKNIREISFGTLEFPSLERLYLRKGIAEINGPLEENLTDIFYEGTEEEWNNVNWYLVDDAENVLGKINKHFGVFGKSVVLSFGEEKIFPFTHWDCIKGKPEEISSEKVSYDSSISGLEALNVKDAIDKLNAKLFDVTSLSSWKELLYLVRSGRAREFIRIGDQLVSMKNGKELVWDVIGIDEDEPVNPEHKYSVTLQLRDCFNNMPYSVPEASYFSVSVLSPGQYYLKINNYSSSPVYYSFTLSEELPMGGLIRISENTVYLYRKRTENYYSSFAVDFTSSNEEDMTGTFLNQENYHIHNELGSVNYKDSDIRKWLNTSETGWWAHSHGRSLAPLDYLSAAGFCNGMDEDFLNSINPVRKKTVLPDGSEVITEDKFFLLSDDEVYAWGNNAYKYYIENSSISEPSYSKDSSRIKMFESAPRHWWLRNPAAGDNGLMRVLTDGGVGSVKATKILAYGVAPACCIC